ncbi:MAG TPA: hypothetical protein QF873_01845 [Patescibacteria group bacterium]|nr:hypothetical protein [Patescibacteria group bacterium]
MPQHHTDLIKAEGLTNVNGPNTDTYGDASGLTGNAGSVWGDLTGLTGDLTGLLDTFTFERGSHGDVAVLAALDESDTLTEWTLGNGDLRTTVVCLLALLHLDPDEEDYDVDLFVEIVRKFKLEAEIPRAREIQAEDLHWPDLN